MRKYIVSPKGGKWTDQGREMWIDTFLRALEGFQVWPVDENKICPDCLEKVFEVADTSDAMDITLDHLPTCAGLKCEPILFIVFWADRRTGKTFNSGAFINTKVFQDKNERIMYMATAEEQTKRLIRENFTDSITKNPDLDRYAQIRDGFVRVPHNHSEYVFPSTSDSAGTGAGLTYLFIDEARDFPGHVFASVVPSTQEQHGVSCTDCSYKIHGHDGVNPDQDDWRGRKCRKPGCKGKLRKWFGRCVVMSAQGRIKDEPLKDWFYNLIKVLEDTPDPNWFLIKLVDNTIANPDVDPTAKGAALRVLGKVEGMKELMDIEFGGQFKREGDKFLSPLDIDQVVKPWMVNEDESLADCVAFLDTSLTTHLTSLIILCDETEKIEPTENAFTYVYPAHIMVWDPKEPDEDGITGIDEHTVIPYLVDLLPRFPRLRGLWVDTRNMKWARRLVRMCNKGSLPIKGSEGRIKISGWGHKVHNFDGWERERNAGWAEVETKIVRRLIRLPPHERMIRELKNAIYVWRSGKVQVREQNKHKLHLDVAENLATCLYFAHVEAMRPRIGVARANRRAHALETGKREVMDKVRARMSNITGGIRPDPDCF